MKVNGRSCPNCGNQDVDDNFKVMICGECKHYYATVNAEKVIIEL